MPREQRQAVALRARPAGLAAAPAAETRHGPSRGRGPQLRDGVGFGHGLGRAFPAAAAVRHKHALAPGPARWAPRRGEARPLSSPSLRRSFQPPAAPPAPGTAPGAHVERSGAGRHGQAAGRAGAAAQPEQEAEEAPAGVRRGAPVL